MRYILATVGSICILLILAPTLQAKGWRGIIPLKSTRADVERQLGKPGAHGRYQFENERAYIDYAEGSCDKRDNRCECLVSEDTVLSISVEPEVEMSFSKLNVDRSKYTKTKYQDPNLATYSNDEEGIIYHVSERDDDVTHIWYLVSAKDCEAIVKKRSRKIQRAHNKALQLTAR